MLIRLLGICLLLSVIVGCTTPSEKPVATNIPLSATEVVETIPPTLTPTVEIINTPTLVPIPDTPVPTPTLVPTKVIPTISAEEQAITQFRTYVDAELEQLQTAEQWIHLRSTYTSTDNLHYQLGVYFDTIVADTYLKIDEDGKLLEGVKTIHTLPANAMSKLLFQEGNWYNLTNITDYGMSFQSSTFEPYDNTPYFSLVTELPTYWTEKELASEQAIITSDEQGDEWILVGETQWPMIDEAKYAESKDPEFDMMDVESHHVFSQSENRLVRIEYGVNLIEGYGNYAHSVTRYDRPELLDDLPPQMIVMREEGKQVIAEATAQNAPETLLQWMEEVSAVQLPRYTAQFGRWTENINGESYQISTGDNWVEIPEQWAVTQLQSIMTDTLYTNQTYSRLDKEGIAYITVYAELTTPQTVDIGDGIEYPDELADDPFLTIDYGSEIENITLQLSYNIENSRLIRADKTGQTPPVQDGESSSTTNYVILLYQANDIQFWD